MEATAGHAGLSEEERRLAEAEARHYEAMSEQDQDAILEESIEAGIEGDEIEIPAR